MYSGKERRQDDRIPVLLSLTYSDGSKFFKEFAHNASVGGVLIKSVDPCDPGMVLDMAIDAYAPVKARGTVAWVNRDRHLYYNVGVKFEHMDAAAVTDWANFLKLHAVNMGKSNSGAGESKEVFI